MHTHFSITAGTPLSEEEAKRVGEALSTVAKALMPTAKVRIMRTSTLTPERNHDGRWLGF